MKGGASRPPSTVVEGEGFRILYDIGVLLNSGTQREKSVEDEVDTAICGFWV